MIQKTIYQVCLVLLIFTTEVSFGQSSNYQSPCSQLIWSDEFNGSSLDSRWTPQIGDGCDINLCGWGNNEAQYYTSRPENLKVENGNLVITGIKENYGGKAYTSARIRSIGQGDFTFGRIEARIKVPFGAGSWPAFWMLPTDNIYGSWPTSGEIDVMEFQGKTPTFISGTVHYGPAYPNNKYNGAIKTLPAGEYYYDDFHVFSVEWDSTEIRWYMDGTRFHSINKAFLFPDTWPFDQRFHLILNLALGGNLGGAINDATMPMTMLVDYVRVYSAPLNVSIKGNNKVYAGDVCSYTLPGNTINNSYLWTVPSGATILSGQGTNQISVQWGNTGGDVSLQFTKPCDVFTLSHAVKVFDPNACSLMLDDAESNINIDYKFSNGALFKQNNNPTKTGINSSNYCNRYARSSNAYDVLIYNNFIRVDASSFETGNQIIYMDVLTYNAAPGTRIELQLCNSEKATAAFPAGRRSAFVAYTTKQTEWERLAFVFETNYDLTTAADEIDQLAILFNGGVSASKTFYLDHFRFGNMPATSISAVNGDTIPCASLGEIYSIVPTAGSTYSWQVPAGATITSGQGSNQITLDWGNSSGYVQVTEQNAAGCTDISGNLRVVLTGCSTTTITDKTLINSLVLSPNPARESLQLDFNLERSATIKFSILNLMGTVLWEEERTANSGLNNKLINVSSLHPGTYVLLISHEGRNNAIRFIKE